MVDSDEFLETTGGSVGGISLASGIRWLTLGRSLVGSVITVIFVAVGGSIDALTTAVGNLIGGFAGWIGTVIETALSAPTGLLESAQATSLAAIPDVSPLLAFPIGVTLVTGSLYIASRGLEVIRS